MRVLLIGDISGQPDEAMKKIVLKLYAAMKSNFINNVTLAAPQQIFLNPRVFSKVDIIHYLPGPSWRSIVYAWLAKSLCGVEGAKSIVTFIHPSWSRLANICIRLFKPDGAIVQSERWKHYCSVLNIRYVSHPIVGADMTKFRPVDPAGKLSIRSKLGLPLNRRIVLHVGHLHRGRNLVPLKRLVDKDVLPIIIGSTTAQIDKQLVRDIEAAGVMVIHRYLESVELFYQAADCYVFPTTDSRHCIQIPLSIIEALACGLPVVSTRFENLPFLFPEEGGPVIYIDQLADLPGKVRQALSNPVNCRTDGLACFDWVNIAAKLNRFYVELLLNER